MHFKRKIARNLHLRTSSISRIRSSSAKGGSAAAAASPSAAGGGNLSAMAVDGDDSDVPDLDDLELEEGDDILPVDPASSVTRPSTPPPYIPVSNHLSNLDRVFCPPPTRLPNTTRQHLQCRHPAAHAPEAKQQNLRSYENACSLYSLV
jgi:hypothetical protein